MSWLARVLGRAPAKGPGSEEPASAEALYSLGLAADAEKRGDDAVNMFRRAAQAQPDNVAYWCALGAAYFRTGRLREAVDACRAGLAADPAHVLTRTNLAFALLALDDYETALDELERVRAQAPELASPLPALGYVQCQLGRNAEGIATLRAALDLAPDDFETRRSLLLALNYSAEVGAAEVFAEHRRFGERAAQPVDRPQPDRAWPRRLRVGYVSPDFNAHVVASFMWPILARHDRERFEVYCYYSNTIDDDATRGLRALADRWVECARLSDPELAVRIRADRIDILVDLAGHTAKSRLTMFALRPAPVQMTYLGYPNTTGLPAIDYRITDERADPAGEAERYHVESLIRLPRTFLCYRPGPDIPGTVPPPAAQAGVVTFGCFNNYQKLSPAFFAAAAEILQRVPGSRLLLKAKPLAFPRVAGEVRGRFVKAGIDPRRVELRGWEPSAESHLAAYRGVDIALDSFPYNGTTTTCEAMWMGVPVVTLRGDRHAARVGSSLLHAVGLDALVARDTNEYVEIAAHLAADLPGLASLRAGMRERMRTSALMDEAEFVHHLEHAYQEAWRTRMEAADDTHIDDLDALTRFWNECHEKRDPAAAIDRLGRALARDGGVGRLHYMLGCTLEDAGRTAEAITAYRRAVERDPMLAKAHNNLGCLLEAAGDLQGAAQSYDQAVHADPGLANALYNRGSAHKRRGDADLAEADFLRALAIEPGHADWHCNLGETLAMQGKPDAAAASHRAALQIDPGDARAHFGLGNALVMMGLAREGEAAFRRALELQPAFAEAHSNLLLAMHYEKGDDGRVMYEEHREWARRHARGLPRASHVRPKERIERPLNIGYLSPDFQQHAVAWLIEPVMAAHDRDAFRLFFYANVASPDSVTERFKKLCHHWRHIHGVAADAVVRQIREDRIDILVDLAGHTGGGRPLLFARKPAPVQVTWQGYPNTTGMAEMDYRITDAQADPPGESDRWHVEKLLRMPCGFLCYAPPPHAPEPVAPPLLQRGVPTFGSFNNLAKVTPATMALWAKLLLRLPQARLVMKAHALGSQAGRRHVHEHFALNGIAAERVLLLGPEGAHAAHLARYAEIDVALDPFPYHGTATTCEALWMGVPVVSLAGRTHVARVGASILERVGLGNLVAADEAQYIETAIRLVSDPARLGELRAELRKRMRASPLLDAAAFARALEGQYRDIWRHWCAAPVGEPADSATTLKLHIGGAQPKEGWKILNIQPGPHVDYAGSCTDLRAFADDSVAEIYASHVLEHLGYLEELPRALDEFRRVLRPGGVARISVPDLGSISRLLNDPRATKAERFELMRMAFGGQMDGHDFHRVGLTYEILHGYLAEAGFTRIERVDSFGIFRDTSDGQMLGVPVTLNVVAYK